MTEKADKDVHSEHEAIVISEKRATTIENYLKHSKDKPRMVAIFELRPIINLQHIYSSMFAWRQWRKAIMDRFIKIKFIGEILKSFKKQNYH